MAADRAMTTGSDQKTRQPPINVTTQAAATYKSKKGILNYEEKSLH